MESNEEIIAVIKNVFSKHRNAIAVADNSGRSIPVLFKHLNDLEYDLITAIGLNQKNKVEFEAMKDSIFKTYFCKPIGDFEPLSFEQWTNAFGYFTEKQGKWLDSLGTRVPNNAMDLRYNKYIEEFNNKTLWGLDNSGNFSLSFDNFCQLRGMYQKGNDWFDLNGNTVYFPIVNVQYYGYCDEVEVLLKQQFNK